MTPTLREQAESFALELMEMFAEVIPQGDLGVSITELEGNFVLTSNDPKGYELQVENVTVMRLEVQYKLIGDRDGRWLKVESSTFAVRPEESGTPYFRYDYLASARDVPEAHINVHAHRDDMIVALVGGGKGATAKGRRRRFVNEGILPQVAKFHFPVGGRRFRPCIEDVLEVVIDEFGLDRQPRYKQALKEGQERYRNRQLKAAVRDNAETAIETLQALGYKVTEPGSLAK